MISEFYWKDMGSLNFISKKYWRFALDIPHSLWIDVRTNGIYWIPEKNQQTTFRIIGRIPMQMLNTKLGTQNSPVVISNRVMPDIWNFVEANLFILRQYRCFLLIFYFFWHLLRFNTFYLPMCAVSGVVLLTEILHYWCFHPVGFSLLASI